MILLTLVNLDSFYQPHVISVLIAFVGIDLIDQDKISKFMAVEISWITTLVERSIDSFFVGAKWNL